MAAADDGQRMRVASVTMCYPSRRDPGQGVFVERRLSALIRHCDVRVICPRPWFPLWRRADCAAARDGAPPVTDVPMLYAPGVLKSLDVAAFARAAERGLRESLAAAPIDLVDAHFEWPDGVGAWRAARKLGLPIVVTLRGKLVRHSQYAARRRQMADMLRDADGLIAVSRSLADLAREIAGRAINVSVVPNGVDASVFRPLPTSSHATTRIGATAGRKILSVGHLQRLKGFDLLIEALPAVRRECGDVRLTLVGGPAGESRFEASLARLVDRLGLRDTVRFAGRLEPNRINELLNDADVFVLASRTEGWSNALTEALAAGTPVVASNVGGNPEQVAQGETGLLFNAEDAADLSERIVEALQRPWNRPAIAARSAARSWSHVADETFAIFRKLLTRA